VRLRREVEEAARKVEEDRAAGIFTVSM